MTTTTIEPIFLSGDYQRRHMAQAVPGSVFDPALKAWVLPSPTPRSAAVALRLFPELSVERPDLVEIRDLLAQDVRPFDNATPYDRHVEAPDVAAQMAAEGKSLYDFQSIDLGYLTDVMAEHGAAYLGWERGLGKTVGTLALADALGVKRLLVVCPNTAKESVWANDIRRWCPHYGVRVMPNDKAKRERLLCEVRDWPTGTDAPALALVVHYEALAIIAGKGVKKGRGQVPIGKGWEKLGTWDLVAADEAHRIKEPKAQMGRALKKIPTIYKVALSGSIIQNHAEELFSVLQWLFPLNYRSAWRDWNDRFIDYVDGAYGKVVIGIKTEAVEEMRRELGVFMTYRRKEDELDLPAKTEETRLVEISPTQRRVYNDLLRTCEATLDSGERIKAADGLVMLGKLRQIATGLDLVGDVADSSKLDLAVEMVRDSEDDAFVIFGWYKASCRALEARLTALGIASFRVDGDVKQEDRADMIERFQAGERRVFIGTLATLGESVTLTRASNAVFLDRHWNPALNVQAQDRIYRIGQDKPVTITHIVARDTVDELRVTPTIANKESLRRMILGGI